MGLTSTECMPNIDSSLKRNRWTEVPTGRHRIARLWTDGQINGERMRNHGNETSCGLEEGQEGLSVTREEMQ